MRTLCAALAPIIILVGIVLAGQSAIRATVDGVDYANGNGDHLPPFSAIQEQAQELDIKIEEMQRKHFPERFGDSPVMDHSVAHSENHHGPS